MIEEPKRGASRTEGAPRRLDVACDLLKQYGLNEEALLLKTAAGIAGLLQSHLIRPGAYRATFYGLMRVGDDYEAHLEITEVKLDTDHEPPR